VYVRVRAFEGLCVEMVWLDQICGISYANTRCILSSPLLFFFCLLGGAGNSKLSRGRERESL
jgi:hypothetical protein